ncbi:MAG TPA: hypothetical protein VNQ32_10700 [Steroidobacteraceae bacterium]|nr:hypothetical protein [Steroidobacteraceae bacterium]
MHTVKSVTFTMLLSAALWLGAAQPVAAGSGTMVQQQAALQYLAAVAAGDPQAMAMAIHEDELVKLRTQLLDQMKLEADRDETITRRRLFGDGMPLVDLERLTPQAFFVTLSQRLRFGSREFQKVEWIEAVNDRGNMVLMVGRLVPLEDMGDVKVPVMVSIVPWGKDWKAAMPLELLAQIDDLRAGRTSVGPRPAVAAAPGQGAPGEAAAPSRPALPQAIITLLDEAEKNLQAGRCEAYFDKQMSPNFRRTTGSRALRTLITSCETRESLREQHLAAIRLAREREPSFEYGGTRAVFDLAGSGLPYRTWAVELVNDRWYIAE